MLVPRSALIAALLMLGVLAKDAATEVATEAAETIETATDVVEDEEDGGFDWGLLGRLGLAGIAGLMRRPQPVVHDTDRGRVDTTRVSATRRSQLSSRDSTAGGPAASAGLLFACAMRRSPEECPAGDGMGVAFLVPYLLDASTFVVRMQSGLACGSRYGGKGTCRAC